MYEDYNPAWDLPVRRDLPGEDYNPNGVVTICGINLEVMDDDSHGFWFVRIIDPDDEKYICNGCGQEHTMTIDLTLCCCNCETLYCHNCDDFLIMNGDPEDWCCKDCPPRCSKFSCNDYDCESCCWEQVREKLLIMKEEEDKDWEICKSCGIKTEINWYRTTNCSCPEDADIDDCECDTSEEGIFCGDCGEYNYIGKKWFREICK